MGPKLLQFLIGLVVFVGLILSVSGLLRKKTTDKSQQPDPLALMEGYKEKVGKLFSQLGLSPSRETYVGFFNENEELSGDGFMYVLLDVRIPGFRRWFIYYPNPKYDVIVMIFDRQLPWDAVMRDKEIIDDFYGFEGELYNDPGNYPRYVWGDRHYFSDVVNKDIAKAAEQDPIWKEVPQQIS